MFWHSYDMPLKFIKMLYTTTVKYKDLKAR